MNMLNSLMMIISASNKSDYTGINIFRDILVIIMVLLAIAEVVIILMQKGTNDNIGVIGGETDTYMGRNKGQNRERKLKLATSIIGGIIVVLAIIYFVLLLVWYCKNLYSGCTVVVSAVFLFYRYCLLQANMIK